MTTLILGSGIIGQALQSVVEDEGELPIIKHRSAAGDRAFDLTDPGPLPDVDRAFIVAGPASIQQCHDNPEASASANVRGTVAVARRLVDQGTIVVVASTNLVFDGQQDAPARDAVRSPACEYGRQKANMEEQVQDGAHIVRLTKVLPPDLGRFGVWARELRAARTVDAFADFSVSPVPSAWVAVAMAAISTRNRPQIWHLGSDHETSYADAARSIATALGADPALVHASSATTQRRFFDPMPIHANLAPAIPPGAPRVPDPGWLVKAARRLAS